LAKIERKADRLQGRWPNLVLVHLPLHASWLNQIEIYFSIAQRKVLAPNDFADVAEVARTLNAFEHHWNEVAEPFDWSFSRDDLAALMERLSVLLLHSGGLADWVALPSLLVSTLRCRSLAEGRHVPRSFERASVSWSAAASVRATP
jgi:hypothetical protein